MAVAERWLWERDSSDSYVGCHWGRGLQGWPRRPSFFLPQDADHVSSRKKAGVSSEANRPSLVSTGLVVGEGS